MAGICGNDAVELSGKIIGFITDGQTDVKSIGINNGINIGINDTQKKIINHLIAQPDVTAKQLSVAVGITKRRVEANISQLKKLGLVEREGARKNGRWVVKNK